MGFTRIRGARSGTAMATLLIATMVMMLALAPGSASAAPIPVWDPAGSTIAPGVSIGTVAVGGMTEADAAAAVRAAYSAVPVAVNFHGTVYRIDAAKLGQVLPLTAALDAAWNVGRDGTATPPPASTTIPFKVQVNKHRLNRWITILKSRTYIAPTNATWKLRRQRVIVIAERPGFVLRPKLVRKQFMVSLTLPGARARSLGRRDNLFAPVAPAVTRRTLGPVVIIDRSAMKATLWSPRRKLRTMSIAVGQPGHETPLGRFTVVQKQKNPRWTPPNSEWAKDAQPIAPGPNNPLGTRWIGLSASGIGMHGTNAESSVGHPVSHGCMRMHRRDVEWLFTKVRIGTPVVILR